jgi:RNA polymerase sigma-70 factor (ECF subfamily)
MKISKANCDQLSDPEVVRRSLDNIDYFGCLYDRYAKRLIQYITNLSNTPEEEAEDILQEAFIKIWANLNEYDSSLKLSSWLYRIVHNETISYIRKKGSYGKNNLIQLDDIILNDLYEDLRMESDKEEIFTLTGKVLNMMPEKYRQYLILKFIEKLSYEEISDILKVPEGTVATRINRAKKLFKKIADKEHISFNR